MHIRRLSSWLSRGALVALLVGCGSGVVGEDQADARPGDDPLEGLASIVVEPGDLTLHIEGTTPAVGTYRAIGMFEGGAEADITELVVFSIDDPTLGSFQGASFSSTVSHGGATMVRATAGSIQGAAALTLVLRQRYRDPAADDLPADVEDLFDGPEDAARAPEGVYPNDDTLVPPNLRLLELHFLPGADNTIYEISFENDTTDVRVYTRCTDPVGPGCAYMPDPAVWSWLSATNRGKAPVTWRVRATDDEGTAVGASGAQRLSFSHDPLEGGIYYWTTREGTAIVRHDFAAEDGEPEVFVDTSMTGGNCVGCHALSRDGSRLVTASSGSTGARVLLLDVATQMPLVPYDSSPRSAFNSFSPDGSRYVGVYANSGNLSYDLNLFDGATGAHLSTIDVGGTSSTPANHPDWSPDGAHIAFTKVGNRTSSSSLAQHVYRGAIEVVTDQGGGNWSTPQVLVPSEPLKNRYYPTYSPDGSLVAFNESTCTDGVENAACDAYDDPTAMVWVVSATPGTPPIAMARANAPGPRDFGETALKNSYPKWAPFVFQRTDEIGSKLLWITFSSSRSYGLRAPPADGTLLWMAAVDPDQVGAGLDPSYPAFVLPFQDLATSNHTAQWTEEVVRVD
jgi:hypothetical protein